ncbi:hypothetical protein BDN72DRAFT_749459, partial [Pluteus cervinus]
IVNVRPPRAPYPPRGFFVCETQPIFDTWQPHLASRKLADQRHARRPCLLLDSTKLRYDVGPRESRLFYHKKKVVGGVFRRVCPNKNGVKWVDGVVCKEVNYKKSARLDDPGKLDLVGYTAGSRSKSKFDWSINNVGPARSPDAIRTSDEDCSAAFAFLWNMCRQRLPPEVIKDFDDFLRSNNMRRMDGHGTMVPDGTAIHGHGTYTIRLPDGEELTFHDVELAPPSGAIGYNYSRAIHTERQPIPWAFSWTTSRRDNKGTLSGGSFFMSKYGIRIAGAANSLIFWNPQEPHGTGLQDYDPGDGNPGFFQAGLCAFVPNRLPKVWKQYRDNELTHAQAMQELEKDADDSIE